MRHAVSGTRDGAEWPAKGETIDLPADEVALLIEQGVVAPIEAADSEPAPENAALTTKAAPRKKG
jgi:hypothetical protein